jgi:magnesium transporter
MRDEVDLTDGRALSLAFMDGHPAAAARVLEGLPAAEAAVVFDRSPARLGGPVMAAMLPSAAAGCVAALSDARALELLATLGTQATVALLRTVPEPRRQALVAGLPTTTSLASTVLLGQATGTVGAWADPDVLALSADTTVEAALAALRRGATVHAWVFVTDGARRLSGALPAARLLQSQDSLTLAALRPRSDVVLPAQTPLTGASAHPGWSLSSALPVIDPGGRLIGVLTHDGLLRALRSQSPAADTRAALGGLPEMLGRTFWQALAGLLSVGLTALPRVPAALPVTAPPAHDG